MKFMRVFARRSAKFWLAVAMVVAALLALGRDRTATHAVNPEIGPSLSTTSPNFPTGSILLVKGGHLSALNTPCVPGDADPTTICVRVWAKGVNNSTGASAFQVHYTYPDAMITVSAAGSQSTWIQSTGRSAACPAGSFTPGVGTYECTTLNAPPPFGATGNGILGTLAIESRNVIGPALVSFSTDDLTYLVDTPANINNAARIPATVRSLNLYVAPCADLTGGDHKVTIADILYVVNRYHTSDPGADLNGSGTVLVDDILIAVGEFNITCTP
ncbi:MAG: hypothetical protein ACREMY_02115 [bacterium]